MTSQHIVVLLSLIKSINTLFKCLVQVNMGDLSTTWGVVVGCLNVSARFPLATSVPNTTCGKRTESLTLFTVVTGYGFTVCIGRPGKTNQTPHGIYVLHKGRRCRT